MANSVELNSTGDLLPGAVPITSDLRAQVDMLWNVLDLAGVSVFWKDRNGSFLGANANLFRALGLDDPDDLIGQTDDALFDPEAAAEFQRADALVMDSGMPLIDFQESLEAVDGRVETLSTSKLPVHDDDGNVVGLMGCFHLVTTVVQTEQALRSLEERYARALEVSRDGLWEFDPETGNLEASPRFVELFDLHDAAGTTLTDDHARSLFGIEFETILDIAHNPLGLGDTVAFDLSRTLRDGTTRWLHITAIPFAGSDDEVSHVVGTAVDVTEKVEREQLLLYQATHDDLTGLPHRRSLLDAVDRALDGGGSSSLLYLDLDQFKLINDSLGHQAGDELLRAMTVRLSDLLDDDHLLARLGGDEFAILTRNCSEAAAEAIAQEVVDALTHPLVVNDTNIYMTCSVGVVHVSSRYHSALDVMRDGDTALYQAKAAGRSCVRVFEPSMRVAATAALTLQNSMHSAVQSDEFVLHYQPIFESGSGRLTGVEALIRWQREPGELVAPAAFLPYLEQTGLMAKVGEWVINEGMRQLAHWRAEYPTTKDLELSLNMSRAQVWSAELFDTVVGAMQTHDIEPHSVVVEVTETAIAENTNAIAVTLQRLRDVGVQVAIDDFGVGQSTLSALYDVPVDIVKIDRAFISRIAAGQREPLIDAVLSIAQSAGLRVTAEGVETEAQRDYLAGAECERLQGFLLGRPVPPDELARLHFPRPA